MRRRTMSARTARMATGSAATPRVHKAAASAPPPRVRRRTRREPHRLEPRTSRHHTGLLLTRPILVWAGTSGCSAGSS
eukprot:scaffold115266_cov65-Phaeocystis_antarctica.AAC.3